MCSDMNFAFSICTYNCSWGFGFEEELDATTKCNEDGDMDTTGKWLRPDPVCKRKWQLQLLWLPFGEPDGPVVSFEFETVLDIR